MNRPAPETRQDASGPPASPSPRGEGPEPRGARQDFNPDPSFRYRLVSPRGTQYYRTWKAARAAVQAQSYPASWHVETWIPSEDRELAAAGDGAWHPLARLKQPESSR